jgi:ribulose-5-phosphate 4-epimerase/fuculose-1-phosphate aldolase
VSEDAATLRERLVTCTRLLAQAGIVDYSGHLSARLPGTDRFLVQDRETSRLALGTDDLLEVAIDGSVLAGQGRPPAEWQIHAGVYRARPDVACVAHGHPEHSTVWSILAEPLLPVRHFAFEFPDGVPVHSDPTHIRETTQGDAVARTLGGGDACLLRSHGTVVVAQSLPELLMDCLDLEDNARTLLLARSAGTPVPLDADETAALRESYARNGFRATKVWDHHCHKARLAGILP